MWFWLIEVPARIVDLWLRAYWIILTVFTMGGLVTMLIALLLDRVGIRWGW